jgi:hypothetical protein
MSAQKPATQKEMIEQMWWKMFGLNGNDGMANDLRDVRENMVTRDACESFRRNVSPPAPQTTNGILKRRAVDAAVIGLIVTVVSNWEKIGKFFAWFAGWVQGG